MRQTFTPALGLALLVACAPVEAPAPSNRCVPGRSEACACGGGRFGAQVCGPDGTWDRCAGCARTECEPQEVVWCRCPLGEVGLQSCGDSRCVGCPSPPERFVLAHADASIRQVDGGPPPDGGVVLVSGPGRLLDVFPVEAGLLVVTTSGILLEGVDGGTQRVPVPRELTAAAHDGTTLVTADRAMLTVYSAALEVQRRALLTAGCASLTFLASGSVVCPGRERGEYLAVYDVRTGDLRWGGDFSRLSGRILPVPGRDDFIALGYSPAVYRVSEAGAVLEVGRGSRSLHQAAALDGRTNPRLVTGRGEVVEVYGPGCGGIGSSGCLTEVSSFELPAGVSAYELLAEFIPGQVYGLTCGTGCVVHRLDAATGAVLGEQLVERRLYQPVIARYDPFRRRLVLAAGGYSENSHEIQTVSP